MDKKELLSYRILLRALTKPDIDLTLKWHNQEDIRDLYLGHPFPINYETEEKWYEKILLSNIPTSVFGIELIENNKLIGLTLLKDINWINRSCEFAIYIGDAIERSKGYSKEATISTLEFAFFKLGLNRVFLKVLVENENAIKLYHKCGFKEEGILRSSIFKNGAFKNELVLSILQDEFLKKYKI
jgi:RimJ/RimL family protein N-acetyltransferase